MNNKVLGTFALIGAPFMFFGMMLENQFKLSDSWFTGFWGIMYITPWMGSIIGLKRANAAGYCKSGRIILSVLIGALIIANISNLIQLCVPHNKPSFFFYLDLSWPLSNVIMLVVGILIWKARLLSGWKRYVPLVAGLWLPISLAILFIAGRSPAAFFISGLYSALAWGLLAVVVRGLDDYQQMIYRHEVIKVSAV